MSISYNRKALHWSQGQQVATYQYKGRNSLSSPAQVWCYQPHHSH